MVPVTDRTADTLLALVQKHIRPGSTIWSDRWKSYCGIENMLEGYEHASVNHKIHFVDPKSGCCTNGIKSDWGKARAHVPRTGAIEEHLEGYIGWFLWKPHQQPSGLNPFVSFMQDVAKIYSGPSGDVTQCRQDHSYTVPLKDSTPTHG